MRIALESLWLAVAASAALAGQARSTGSGQAAPPRVLLYLPLNGSTDVGFSANGRVKTTCLAAAYRPGVKAQGAEFGSDRYPSALVLPCEGLLDKRSGSLEFWFMPLWNPADSTQQRSPRMLVTDEKDAGVMGHLWLGVEGASVVFGAQGQEAVVLHGSIHRWQAETWHQVVATWDGQTGMQLFLDGERVAEQTLRWALPPSQTLYVGATRYGGSRSGGLFDELRLYDRALTATEVELAFIHNLDAKNAPARALPERPAPAPSRAPRLSLHLTFDNVVEAQRAAGDPRPVVSEGVQFRPGLLGQALVADAGLKLAYQFEKNVARQAGAVTLWASSLPEKRIWRGILVSDDAHGSDPPREVPGSVALWLQREGGVRALFALWPMQLLDVLPRWDEREWYHFAACWREFDQVTFYVNGRESGRLVGEQAVWAGNLAKRLYVGSLAGKLPAGALIDDVRFYDAPLTVEQVQKEASQFLLPYVLVLGRTLYERGQAADLRLWFYNVTAEDAAAALTVRVLSPDGTEVARGNVSVVAPAHAWGKAVTLALSADALASAGQYEVVTSCEGRTSCPRSSFLVVAPEAKEAPTAGEIEPGQKPQHVETIECAKQATPDIFCETGGSRVVKSALGAYREAGEEADARIAYRFRLTETNAPHVAVVSYPADRARSAEIIMTSRHHPASYDVATGYFVDQADAATPRMVDLPIYFWPREGENAITLRTLQGGQPAACAKITIRRLPARLPAAAVAEPAGGGRSFGLHWDDPAVPLQFGAASQRPAEVYESFRRLVDYLRFTGQNLLCYPVAWHRGSLFPAASESFRLGAGAERHCLDWIEYVLYLCERRGIQFLPETVFDDTLALSTATGADTIEGVVQGRDTPRMVAWDDSLTRAEPGGAPRYNPLHPTVRAALLAHVTEIVDRYGKSPALVGVSVYLGPGESTWYGSIQCGYDDAAVAEFEKEIGMRVPEGGSGPTRFSERARWILANKYDQWVAFRCRRLRQVYVDLASRLESKRPGGLKLYLTVALPDSLSPFPLMNLSDWASRPNALNAIIREAGIDPSLFADRPTNLVLRRVTYPSDSRFLGNRFGSGGPNPHRVLASDLAFLSEGAAPFLGFPRGATAASYHYFESAIGASRPIPGFWWQDHPLRASHPTEAGREFLKACAHAVAECDVATLTTGGGNLTTRGHEDEVREFARAFRALPAERFSSLFGMCDPVCAREFAGADGRTFYLVNRASVPVDAFVAFSAKDVKLRDFAAAADIALPYADKRELPAMLPKEFVSEHLLPDEEGPGPGDVKERPVVTGALLHVVLEPHQLRSYRVLTPGAQIHYAACEVPATLRTRLAQRIESAKTLVANSHGAVDVQAAARATLDLVLRAWRKGEVTRVEHLLDSYPLARLR